MIQNMGETQVLSTTAAVLAEGRLSTGADMTSRGTHACERGGDGGRQHRVACRLPGVRARVLAREVDERTPRPGAREGRLDLRRKCLAGSVSLQLDSARVLE